MFLKICTKFHKKILNGYQEIENRTPEWALKYAKMLSQK